MSFLIYVLRMELGALFKVHVKLLQFKPLAKDSRIVPLIRFV